MLVDCAHLAWKEIILLNFFVHPPAENSTHPHWASDPESDPCESDSWATGMIPVVNKRVEVQPEPVFTPDSLETLHNPCKVVLPEITSLPSILNEKIPVTEEEEISEEEYAHEEMSENKQYVTDVTSIMSTTLDIEPTRSDASDQFLQLKEAKKDTLPAVKNTGLATLLRQERIKNRAKLKTKKRERKKGKKLDARPARSEKLADPDTTTVNPELVSVSGPMHMDVNYTIGRTNTRGTSVKPKNINVEKSKIFNYRNKRSLNQTVSNISGPQNSTTTIKSLASSQFVSKIQWSDLYSNKKKFNSKSPAGLDSGTEVKKFDTILQRKRLLDTERKSQIARIKTKPAHDTSADFYPDSDLFM